VWSQPEIWVDRVEDNGRLLVPLRGIFESFGADVDWDSVMREVRIRSGPEHIVMYVDDPVAYINAERHRLQAPPRIVHNRTHVPLRFVGEALGASVAYRGDYVDITSAGGYRLRVHLVRTSGVLPGGRAAGIRYIAAWTSKRPATNSDLRGYSNWELTLMREEIAARRGSPFDSTDVQAYFLRQPWYVADYGYQDSRLTDIERANVGIILDFQKRVFGSPATRP